MACEKDVIAVTDPVCGLALNMADVAGSALYQGWAYYFCSKRCREQFAGSPGSYSHSPNLDLRTGD